MTKRTTRTAYSIAGLLDSPYPGDIDAARRDFKRGTNYPRAYPAGAHNMVLTCPAARDRRRRH